MSFSVNVCTNWSRPLRAARCAGPRGRRTALPSASCRGESMRAPLGVARRATRRSRRSSRARSRADRSRRGTRCTTAWCGGCSSRSRTVSGLSPVSCVFQVASTPGGGGVRRRADDLLQDPRAAQHRRRAVRVRRHHQHAPLPSRPRRLRSSRCTRRNCAPRTSVDAVVKREPLVHERLVRGQQVDDAAVLAQHAVEEELDLLAKASRRSPSNVGNRFGSGSMASSLRTLSHWNAKFVTSDSGAGRRACAAPARAAPSARAASSAPQAIAALVRHLAPEEERQPRRELQIADGIRAPGCAPVRRLPARARYRNFGLARIAMSAFWMPASKPPCSRPCVVERERGVEIVGADGPAERLARQRREDCSAHGRSSPRASAGR